MDWQVESADTDSGTRDELDCLSQPVVLGPPQKVVDVKTGADVSPRAKPSGVVPPKPGVPKPASGAKGKKRSNPKTAKKKSGGLLGGLFKRSPKN